jgi:hypothetical protein
MASVFTFGGVATRRPTVRAIVEDGQLFPAGVGRLQTVAIVGTGKGGEPKVPLVFGSPSAALAMVRGGDLAKAIPRVFSPSAESQGASLVAVVRVNPATQATLTLLDGAAADAIDVKAVNWGSEDNLINLTVATGADAGSKKVSVSYLGDSYVRDNLLRNMLSIQYTGAGSAAEMDIDGTTLATTVTGGPGGEDLALTLADFNTVQELATYINAQAAYTATLLADNPSGALVNKLDFVTAQDIDTAPFTVTAVLQAVVDWLNSGAQPLVTAARASGAGAAPANIGPVYLTGGAEGSTLTADWAAALAALETYDVAYVVPLSSDAAVHAMTLTHVNAMSADGKRVRAAFVGAALGEKTADLSNYITRVQALNSDRMAFIAEGVKDFDTSGAIETLAPPFLAAQVAGLQAGLDSIGEPLTGKTLQLQGLEWVPTAGDLERMLETGIMPIEQVINRGFFRVTRGITTWLKNSAFHRVEVSTRAALDEVIRRVILDQEPLLGRKASPLILGQSGSKAESTLRVLQREGIIVGDSSNPAYKNISATLEGDRISLSFSASPVLPLNFISVTIHATTFSGTVSIVQP